MKRLNLARFGRDYAGYILIVFGIAVVLIVTTALLGPATGNVFSNIYSNVGPPPHTDSVQPYAASPLAQPAVPTAANNLQPVALRNPSSAPFRSQRLIIKKGEMNLVVADTDRAVDQITSVALEAGGYVIVSRSWMQDKFKYAAITLGVPVDQFEAVQRQLRGLAAQVVSDTASGQDVSDEYVDLQSRVTNLEATAARIREFLKQATDVEQALAVNGKLTEVEAELEQVKGRMAYLQDRSAYSTLTINLAPQQPTPTSTPSPSPTPTATPDVWQPDRTLAAAGNQLDRMLRGLGDLAIWFGVTILPFATPVLIVSGLGWRSRRKQAAKAPPRNGVE